MDLPDIPTPLELPSTTVKPEWIDFNGHMNVAYYLLAFDKASETLDEFLGLSPEYRTRTNNGTFAGDIHIAYRQELKEGDPIRMTGRVIDCDAKRVHYWIEMFHGTEGYLAATSEYMILHIDMSVRRVAPMDPDMVDWIGKVRDAHAALGTPNGLGKVMRVPAET
jgi:acyl-CoA thioester hydrolase